MDINEIIFNAPVVSGGTPPPTPARQKLDGVTIPYSGFSYLSSTVGAVLLRFTMPASIASKQVLVGSSNIATANDWFEIGVDSDSRAYIQTSASGSVRTIKAVTVLAASTEYTLAIVFDGTDYFVRLDGVEENPLSIEAFAVSPGWFGTVTSGSDLRVGATVTSGGNQRTFQGTITAIEIYSTDITA